jgi:hypothetical protein
MQRVRDKIVTSMQTIIEQRMVGQHNRRHGHSYLVFVDGELFCYPERRSTLNWGHDGSVIRRCDGFAVVAIGGNVAARIDRLWSQTPFDR